MSKRTRVKEIKRVLGDVSSGGINQMFEEMMGLKDANPDIIRPKFVKARNLIRHTYRVLMQFGTFVPLRDDFPDLKEALDQIVVFAESIKEQICFSTSDQDETEEMYLSVSKDELNGLYKKLKESPAVKDLIVLCNKLNQYSKYFKDVTQLRDNFIGQEPGLSLLIFPFSTLDLKKLWANNRTKPSVKKYILSILHALYKDVHAVYKTVTSPDVDIDKFTSVLLESIDRLRTEPGLSRCKNAFKRIETSVSLLKEKFEDYYRESVASENPNMIIESFIVDVSNQGGADARLTREFRDIIKYMHKLGAQNGKNKDPNVQKIYAVINKNFSMMTGKAAANDDLDDEPNTSDSKTAVLDDLDFSLKTTDDVQTDMQDNKADSSSNTTGLSSNTTGSAAADISKISNNVDAHIADRHFAELMDELDKNTKSSTKQSKTQKKRDKKVVSTGDTVTSTTDTNPTTTTSTPTSTVKAKIE